MPVPFRYIWHEKESSIAILGEWDRGFVSELLFPVLNKELGELVLVAFMKTELGVDVYDIEETDSLDKVSVIRLKGGL